MSRTISRELAVQALFCADLLSEWDKSEVQKTLDYLILDRELAEETYSRGLVDNICKHRAQIDSVISESSNKWPLKRMGRVDRSILRVACYELIFDSSIAHSIVINEAIELARSFGGEESASFVNAVSDKIAKLNGHVTSEIPLVDSLTPRVVAA